MSDSLEHFVRDAMREHDGADPLALPTVIPDAGAGGSFTGGHRSLLPGHDVEGLLGRGGMGVVYRATQQALEREVAVKVMTSHAESPEMAERFRREALVLGRLEHPNIVPIHELGIDDDGQLYYTMKLVKGRTLQAILHDLRDGDAETLRQHSLASLLTVFRKVCDALAFAHSQGVLHRDLKPANIMVGEFGEVLVMDWGLAKLLGSNEETQSAGIPSLFDIRHSDFIGTLQGSVMGTPQYMSPEQAMGLVKELDERSDIFSLGSILYAILTLRPPIEGTTLDEVLQKVRTAEITLPSHIQNGPAKKKDNVLEAKLVKPLPHASGGRVPPALSSVVMKALRLDKMRRYPSVAVFSADIERYQAGFATSAEQAGAWKQLRLLIKRNQGIFSTAAAAWLVITTLGIWFVLNLHTKEQRAIAGEQAAILEKEAARRSSATANLSLAEASLREANGPAMRAALNAVPEDLRDTTWGYLLAQSDSSLAPIRTGAEAIDGVAADPTRPSVFAVADRNRKVTVLNVRTGERLLEFQAGFAGRNNNAREYRIAFSPDGQHIAVGRDGPGGLVIHRARDGFKESAWPTPPTERLEFGRNDALLRQGDGSLQVWNPLTGQLWWEEKIASNIGVKGTFTPGGNEVLKFTSRNRLQLVKANDGSLIRDLGGRKSGYDWFMAVRPDGKAVVTWNETHITECISLEDGRILFALPDKKLRWHMGFSHDGAMLFTAALRDEGVQSIEIWDAVTGAFLRSLLGGRGQITGLSLHPSSNELLVCGPDSRVWDTTGPLAPWRFNSLPSGNIAFWGPDDSAFGWVADPTQWGLYRLRRDGTELLWQPEPKAAHLAETSADGKLAVLIRPGFGRGETILLRKSGSSVEQANAFTTKIWPFRVRPSPQGTRVAFMTRTKDLGLQVYDTKGKVAVELDRTEHKRLSDLGWLSERRLVGLVTLQANRGNPGSRECIILWDADTGKILQTATHPTAVDALAIAPDGSRFAEAGADKIVRIRDAKTLMVQKEFRAHDGPITALSWHPTKPIIATGSEDLSVKVWNLEMVQCVSEYRDMLNSPVHLSFSPTGRLLGAKTFSDNLVRIWQFEERNPPQ